MSGGAYEYTMGNMVNASGQFYSSSAGFATAPEAKYYDTYEYGTSHLTHSRGLLGDATKETMRTGFGSSTAGGWYADYSYFPSSAHSWFLRGGSASNTTYAGAFSVGINHGTTNNCLSWRVVVVPLD